MAVKLDDQDGSKPKIPLHISSHFDNLSAEDTADIFDDLVGSDGDDESEPHSPSLAPATERQRDRALGSWRHAKFWQSIRKSYPDADLDQVWVDLCRNDTTAFRICKAFLKF